MNLNYDAKFSITSSDTRKLTIGRYVLRITRLQRDKHRFPNLRSIRLHIFTSIQLQPKRQKSLRFAQIHRPTITNPKLVALATSNKPDYAKSYLLLRLSVFLCNVRNDLNDSVSSRRRNTSRTTHCLHTSPCSPKN